MGRSYDEVDVVLIGVVENGGGGVSYARLNHDMLVADLRFCELGQILLNPVDDLRAGQASRFYAVGGRIDDLLYGVKERDLRPVGQGQFFGVPQGVERSVRKVDRNQNVANRLGRGHVLLTSHGEHGTGGSAKHLLSHASDEQALQAAAPVGARYDEVDVVVVGVVDDGVRRRSTGLLFLNQRERSQIDVLRRLPLSRKQISQGVLRDGEGPVHRRRFSGSVFLNVEHVELRLVPGRKRGGVGKCARSPFRKIGRPENPANRKHTGSWWMTVQGDPKCKETGTECEP